MRAAMLLDQDDHASAAAVARGHAEEGALHYVSDLQPGITRRRAGKGFSYRHPDGRRVDDVATLGRIRALAVPPAWTEVWICPSPDGHIQATGRDNRGRKQYRYHPLWRAIRDVAKYGRMLDFAQALPAIRARVAADMAQPGLPREKVLATIANLLETTLIRIGNQDYARQNRSYGLTTLRARHVTVKGAELRFTFRGKAGKAWQLRIQDRRIARVIRSCQELPGQELFQYRVEDGSLKEVTSTDVNAYLREISGSDITAKDFRTWAGTVMAALALEEVAAYDSQAAAKRHIRAAIERVAARLGNTPTICRQCYVHPAVLEAYLEGGFALDAAPAGEWLQPAEAAVLAFLRARLG